MCFQSEGVFFLSSKSCYGVTGGSDSERDGRTTAGEVIVNETDVLQQGK
jgi:hypothetical protein